MAIAPHIRVENLDVRYGAVRALKGITADIPRKMISVIIGPSGCGKSTLLRTFNRLVETAGDARVSGRVLVDGADIFAPGTDVTAVRKRMGLLSQRPYPLPMSIFDNVAYGPRVHGVRDRRTLAAVVEGRLRQAGLWEEVRDRLHAPASRLSLGQQQRLCLARGLAVEPEIILGDEPTSALDPRSSQHIERIFMELKREYTIVLVTHILRQARRLADYVLFLYLGELVEHGPAREIFENPREEMTRDYIGGAIS
ncbi:MAG: phosphate ABC transporter ATP-binding protein [bacterium]|nr:phosphate ABC transporter ATP-binding protein [bacterium]